VQSSYSVTQLGFITKDTYQSQFAYLLGVTFHVGNTLQTVRPSHRSSTFTL